jgi:hypothetical protein
MDIELELYYFWYIAVAKWSKAVGGNKSIA